LFGSIAHDDIKERERERLGSVFGLLLYSMQLLLL